MVWLLAPWLALGALAAPAEIPLFPEGEVPGEVPGFPGPEARSPNIYPSGYHAVEVTNVSRPTITPFLVSNGTGGSVIIAPGGGYSILAITLEGIDVARRLNAMGVSAFLLKYRVPLRPAKAGMPYAWAQLQDAQRAVSLVRSRAAEWGVRPNKIGFMGFSAGGHLTAHLAGSWSNRLYSRIDAIDDFSSRPDVTLPIYPWRLLKNDSRSAIELATEIVVDPTTPPAFIAQNGDDTDAFPENSLFYFRALREVSPAVTASLHIYPTGGHGFGICQVFTTPHECCEWPEQARRWLQDCGLAPADQPLDQGMHLV